MFEQTQLEGRCYIQQNDTQHNDSQHKVLICDTQHKWYSAYKTLSIKNSHNADCHVLFIVVLNGIILSVVMLSVLMLGVVTLSVVMLSVIARKEESFEKVVV